MLNIGDIFYQELYNIVIVNKSPTRNEVYFLSINVFNYRGTDEFAQCTFSGGGVM